MNPEKARKMLGLALNWLGNDKQAAVQELGKQFRQISTPFHPDRNANKSQNKRLKAAAMFKKLSEAKAVLGEEIVKHDWSASSGHASSSDTLVEVDTVSPVYELLLKLLRRMQSTEETVYHQSDLNTFARNIAWKTKVLGNRNLLENFTGVRYKLDNSVKLDGLVSSLIEPTQRHSQERIQSLLMRVIGVNMLCEKAGLVPLIMSAVANQSMIFDTIDFDNPDASQEVSAIVFIWAVLNKNRLLETGIYQALGELLSTDWMKAGHEAVNFFKAIQVVFASDVNDTHGKEIREHVGLVLQCEPSSEVVDIVLEVLHAPCFHLAEAQPLCFENDGTEKMLTGIPTVTPAGAVAKNDPAAGGCSKKNSGSSRSTAVAIAATATNTDASSTPLATAVAAANNHELAVRCKESNRLALNASMARGHAGSHSENAVLYSAAVKTLRDYANRARWTSHHKKEARKIMGLINNTEIPDEKIYLTIQMELARLVNEYETNANKKPGEYYKYLAAMKRVIFQRGVSRSYNNEQTFRLPVSLSGGSSVAAAGLFTTADNSSRRLRDSNTPSGMTEFNPGPVVSGSKQT